MGLINCTRCGKSFYKQNKHINENLKLGHSSYCSLICQSLSKSKQKQLICHNPSCHNAFKRKFNQISFRNFCSRQCAAAINGPANGLRHKKLRYCAYCGNRLSGNQLYCSSFCAASTKNLSKSDLLENLKELANRLGRTPTKRECRQVDSYRKYFGSWNEALIAANLQPHRSLNQCMYKRRRCISLDGHICDSVSELIIDNWLFVQKIAHQKGEPYPESNHRVDWKLPGDVFVEYLGLANDSKRYDIEIKKKRCLSKKFGIKLIEIYPKDLFPNNRLLKIFKIYQFISSLLFCFILLEHINYSLI